MGVDRQPEAAPTFIRDLTPVPDEPVLLDDVLTGDVTTSADDSKNSLTRRQAEKFFDKITKGGMKPSEAAHQMGTSLRKINSSQEMTAVLTDLTGTFQLSAEIRKKMVQAGLTKIFVENLGSDDIERQKLALATAKQIALDPEINAGQEYGAQVNIEVTDMGSRLKGLVLPGIEPPKETENANAHGTNQPE